jgi:hypothetical protein
MSASILARYYAARAVKAQLQSRKIKPAEVADLRRVAEVYLAEWRTELLAQAEQTIASWPPLRKLAEAEAKRHCVRNGSRIRTLPP